MTTNYAHSIKAKLLNLSKQENIGMSYWHTFFVTGLLVHRSGRTICGNNRPPKYEKTKLNDR